MSFDHVGTMRTRTAEGIWIQAFDKYVVKVLEMLGMQSCISSTSAKLDKASLDDDEDSCEDAALYRTAVCMLLYAAKPSPQIQSTIRGFARG